MKLFLQSAGAAALAIAVSASAQQGTARMVSAAARSGPTTAGQDKAPDSGGATLKETSDWLKVNLEAYGAGCFNDNADGNNRRLDHRIFDVSIDNSCRLSYQEAAFWPDNNKSLNKPRLISIPLGAVSDIHVYDAKDKGEDGTGCNYGSTIVIKTGNIVGGADIDIKKRPSVPAGAEIPPTPEQMALRIQKAIQHAVELCRGTYKAPPTAKEPF
jgi:hypothetical protein